MLTEPIECDNCKAVSINGGRIVCGQCFDKQQKEIERQQAELAKLQARPEIELAPGTVHTSVTF